MKNKLKEAYLWFLMVVMLASVVGSVVYAFYRERQQWQYRQAVIELARREADKK